MTEQNANYCDTCTDREKSVCKLPNQSNPDTSPLNGVNVLSGLAWGMMLGVRPTPAAFEVALEATVAGAEPVPEPGVFVEIQRCIDEHQVADLLNRPVE